MMRRTVARPARAMLSRLGYDVVPRNGSDGAGPVAYPPDFDASTIALIERVRPYTLTGPERIAALRNVTRHLVETGVPGAFVECGVWRGGSMQAIALTLLECGSADRDLYLYDTFGRIPRPSHRDMDIYGRSALADWEQYDQEGLGAVDPHYHPLRFEEVRAALLATGYPPERISYVKGDVRETLPGESPDTIALLRLDTDYYDSTLHELRHLEPLVSDGGAVLIDDYGHYSGARDAVDEYYAEAGAPALLQRIDYTARLVLVRR